MSRASSMAPPTKKARPGSRRALPTLLPLLAALLLLLSSAPAPALARKKDRRPSKAYCSSLERTCGFGDNGWERNSASFVLETPSGGGPPVCSVTYDGGPQPTCSYDPETGALAMKLECYSGSGYAVVQQACGPIVEDDQGLSVLDTYVLPAPNQNQFENTGYCAAEVEPPLAGEAVEWFVQVYCAEFEEVVPDEAGRAAGGGAKRPQAARRPAVATFEQSARANRARAAAKAAAAAAKAAAAAPAAAAAGK